MTIFLDMDGTIADLYGTKDWLPRLRAYDAKIYAEARPLCNMNTLARKLNKIQRKGVKIGVISWGSKDKNPEFLEAVKAEKIWAVLLTAKKLIALALSSEGTTYCKTVHRAPKKHAATTNNNPIT